MQAEILAERDRLNALPDVDYPAVMACKMRFYEAAYREWGGRDLASKAYQQFFAANEDWLPAYAALSALRDRFETPEFAHWQDFARGD